MDKKIGKIIFLILFCVQMMYAESEKITINVVNKYQKTVSSVEIGIPFLVMVTCQGFGPDGDINGFELLNDATIQPYSTSQSSSYVNGQITEKYTIIYAGVANKKGPLTLGPVLAKNSSGKTITSSKVTIQVTDIQEHEHTGKESYLLDVSIEPKKVYVGQKLKIILRFCYQSKFENLAIENMAIEDVEFGAQDQEWKQGTINIASKEYSCKEVTFEVYPKKVGALIIPPYKASFISERSQDIGLFSLFGFSNSQVVESYPKQIEVLPLPIYSKGIVNAIGQFNSVEMQLSAQTAQVEEGIIVKMIVQGDGNFPMMHHPKFYAPEGIHFYEGNSSIDKNKKIFEWVLQSDQPGTFVIPEQRFTYFDPVDEKYKELLTKPVRLTIEGKPLVVDKVEEEAMDGIKSETEEVDFKIDDIDPGLLAKTKKASYYSAEKFYKSENSQLLQTWIKIILALLLLLFCMYILRPYVMKIFFIQTLGYRILFWKYHYNGDVVAIYQLFERLVQSYNLGLQSLELHHCFTKINLSNEVFENWKNFMNMLLEFNFAKEKSIEDKKLALDLAKQWFAIILNCCKQNQKESIGK